MKTNDVLKLSKGDKIEHEKLGICTVVSFVYLFAMIIAGIVK